MLSNRTLDYESINILLPCGAYHSNVGHHRRKRNAQCCTPDVQSETARGRRPSGLFHVFEHTLVAGRAASLGDILREVEPRHVWLCPICREEFEGDQNY